MRLGEQIASLVYPLDTFSMYAPVPGASASNLLVRDRAGGLHAVTDFRAFDCNLPANAADLPCADAPGIRYHYEDLLRYVAGHAGQGTGEADLVSRTWELRAGTAPRATGDCVVAHCRVAR
jgi:hypothetical protein